MNITEKYLNKIIKETLTHTEVIAIGHGLIEWLKNDNELLLLAQVFTKYGLNYNMRKTVAKLMLSIINERKQPNPFALDLINDDIDF